jgi:hypothetical protein
MGGQHPGHLADIPFDRMQPVATVGDVGCADVLAGGDEIGEPLWKQGAERELEG